MEWEIEEDKRVRDIKDGCCVYNYIYIDIYVSLFF
jgi:hypothetical protein